MCDLVLGQVIRHELQALCPLRDDQSLHAASAFAWRDKCSEHTFSSGWSWAHCLSASIMCWRAVSTRYEQPADTDAPSSWSTAGTWLVVNHLSRAVLRDDPRRSERPYDIIRNRNISMQTGTTTHSLLLDRPFLDACMQTVATLTSISLDRIGGR